MTEAIRDWTWCEAELKRIELLRDRSDVDVCRLFDDARSLLKGLSECVRRPTESVSISPALRRKAELVKLNLRLGKLPTTCEVNGKLDEVLMRFTNEILCPSVVSQIEEALSALRNEATASQEELDVLRVECDAAARRGQVLQTYLGYLEAMARTGHP